MAKKKTAPKLTRYEDAINRMWASQERYRGEQEQIGAEVGEIWARERATPEQLVRLKTEYLVHGEGWGWRYAGQEDKAAELFASDADAEAPNYGILGTANFWLNAIEGIEWTPGPDFIEGFCNGIAAVWQEKEDDAAV
jgi:hypothetical protein